MVLVSFEFIIMEGLFEGEFFEMIHYALEKRMISIHRNDVAPRKIGLGGKGT